MASSLAGIRIEMQTKYGGDGMTDAVFAVTEEVGMIFHYRTAL